MGWDVFIFTAPATVESVDEIPQDFDAPALGGAAEVRQRLREDFPSVDLTDPAWGHLVGATWRIALDLGADDPVDAITLHARGGDDVLPVIERIVATVGGRALDISTGAFLAGAGVRRGGGRGSRRSPQ